MPIGKKVRIYDLARDLKQDTKRIMEDLRREGADVSVPSNSVSVELAEKIRNKYFPKVEAAPKRAIKIIKAVKKEEHAEVEEETPHVEAAEAEEQQPVEVAAPEEVRPRLSKRKSLNQRNRKRALSRKNCLSRKRS